MELSDKINIKLMGTKEQQIHSTFKGLLGEI